MSESSFARISGRDGRLPKWITSSFDITFSSNMPSFISEFSRVLKNSETAFAIMHQLLEADRATRASIRGVMKERADVVIGGLLPLVALMRQLAIDEVSFSNSGLREGVLVKYLEHAMNLPDLTPNKDHE